MMINRLLQTKIIYWFKPVLFVFVFLVVGTLFGVRVYNTLQKVNYTAETIFQDGNVQILMHRPVKIPSSKIDLPYPLTVSLHSVNSLSTQHVYEIILQSPTLLFVDAKGADIDPRLQFTSNQKFLERGIFIRSYLSQDYTEKHTVLVTVLIDGVQAPIQPRPIEIDVEPRWFSFFSLAAASLLEISIASALIGWAANAIDASLSARKERVAKIREKLSALSSMSYLEQMGEARRLESDVSKEHLDGELRGEIDKMKNRFKKEEDFFRALGDQLQQGKDSAIDFKTIQELHDSFYPQSNHKHCAVALGEILKTDTLSPETACLLLTDLYRLWDDFDADARDLVVNVSRRLASVDLQSVPAADLEHSVFQSSIPEKPNHRRRLLRNTEIQRIFPQLVDPKTGKPNPLGYDARWLHFSDPVYDPKVLVWLKEFALVSNPFGGMGLKNYPFYPEGFVPPDHWADFLRPVPQVAQSPTTEDAKALAYYFRAKCLPVRRMGAKGEEIIENNQQVFPVWVSFNQSATIEAPLLTIARSAAQAWLDILCLSPDAILDLPFAEQEALLDLLCWAVGSNNVLCDLLRQGRTASDNSNDLLVHKAEQFQSNFSATQIPQDAILLSWLKIKPPDLHSAYLIIPMDEIPLAVKGWWLEQFNSLTSRLFLNGVVTKAFSSLSISGTLSLPEIHLHWSDSQLRVSLKSQFEAAMDKSEQRDMGKIVDFRSLFGTHPAVGYLKTEEETTERLISASHRSLARMLNFGNGLFQYHCRNRIKDGVPEKYLYTEDLETILAQNDLNL